MNQAIAPYLSPGLRSVTGPALRPGGLALTRRALAWAGFAPGERVLDLGCGPGQSLAHMARELGLNVMGLDLEPRMLAEAREAYPGPGLVQAEAGAIPLADCSQAGVLAECVLSLMPEPVAVLKECRRVLAPRGRLLLSDLYFRRPFAERVAPAMPGCLGGARGRDAWEELLRSAGFGVLLWEDHSPYLRELTARLVWEHGSAAAFWSAWCGGPFCNTAMDDVSGYRPGYFLLAARKEEVPDG